MGGGGAQRPVGSGNEPKKTGARSAQARTRGQNPLVWCTVLEFLNNLWGLRNRVGIGFLSYRPARLHRLAELIPGLLKSLKIRALYSSLALKAAGPDL
jgi:hypothetical protein